MESVSAQRQQLAVVSPPRWLMYVALTAAAYGATGVLGMELARVHGSATLIWPPSGIAIGALILGGVRLWPGVWIGAAIVNLWVGSPLWVVAVIAAGNALEAIVAASLLRWRVPGGLDLSEWRHLVLLIVFGFVLSPVIAATVGATTLGLAGASSSDWLPTWASWWLGDAAGGLLFAPLLLVWSQRDAWRGVTGRQAIEASILLLLLVLASALGASYDGTPPLARQVGLFASYPLMIWAALRFGLRGATAAAFLVLVVTAWRAGETLAAAGAEEFGAEMVSLLTHLCVIAGSALLSAALSERERFTRSLERSQNRYRTLVESAPICIHEIDLDGRLTTMNEAGLTMLGVDGEAAVRGREYVDFVSTSDRPRIRALLEQARTGQSIEFDFHSGEGESQRIFSSSFVPIRDERGAVAKIMGHTEEVTSRRRDAEAKLLLQQQLLHAQKLEGLGLLAGGVAHDFNNILSIIIGNAELVRLGLKQRKVDVAESLDAIIIASNRAAGICRQMLAYSGKARVETVVTDLSQLVAELGTLLEASIPKSLALTYALDDVPILIDADATQIHQVLLNLVTNAVDAAGEQGTVTVATGVEVLRPETLNASWRASKMRAGPYAWVETRDDGGGIAPETLERIFDPFFSTKGQGRGLGLAAVLGIVRAHGGGIRVETEVGAGTCCRVYFPISEQHAPVSVAAVDVEGGPTPVTVLVVDDEPAIRSLLSRTLIAKGMTVLTAVDGVDALEVYDRHAAQIALVLLDLTMPRMGGIEAARRLRERDPTLPLVLSSGYSQRDTEAIADLGAFLPKPYSDRKLLEVLDAELAQAARRTAR